MRRTLWGLAEEATTGLPTGNITALDLTQDLQARMGIVSMNGYTVTRIIGSIFYRSNDVPSLDNVQQAAFGIGVFDSNLPLNTHPSPRTEDADWMWQYTPLWVPWTIEASAGSFRILMNEIRFDIKTQRVLKAGTERRLRLVILNVGSEGIDVNLRCRTLLRAP